MPSPPDVQDLPDGWTAEAPGAGDVPELHDLLRRHELAARGGSSATVAGVEADVVGAGAATRQHAAVRDDTHRLRAWATVHDRAAGRSLVSVLVDPALETPRADLVVARLLDWITAAAVQVGASRGLTGVQLDSGAFADDARQQRWLTAAGFEQVRSWWQMSRPTDPAEGRPGTLPEPKPGVEVRRVRRDDSDGLPLQSDLSAIHTVLETAFTDHFNYHEETFEEFCSRLREDPGHRWDHWWLASLVESGQPARPVGALVAAESHDDDGMPEGSYVEYLGVLRSARGRGVAKSLLHAVFADAAARGRTSVGIEVDRDSSTGAADLYLSMGFVTKYVTQSWHRDVPVPA